MADADVSGEGLTLLQDIWYVASLINDVLNIDFTTFFINDVENGKVTDIHASNTSESDLARFTCPSAFSGARSSYEIYM